MIDLFPMLQNPVPYSYQVKYNQCSSINQSLSEKILFHQMHYHDNLIQQYLHLLTQYVKPEISLYSQVVKSFAYLNVLLSRVSLFIYLLQYLLFTIISFKILCVAARRQSRIHLQWYSNNVSPKTSSNNPSSIFILSH